MERISTIDMLDSYKKLRENIIMAKYPPNYSDDFSFYSKCTHFNCYAYAMQFRQLGFEYEPGFINAHVPETYNVDKLVNSFYSDLELLEIEHSTCDVDTITNNDEYKIGIMIEKYGHHSNDRDFHFIRCNIDGSWSEKAGYTSYIRKIENIKQNNKYDLIDIVKIKRKISKSAR